MRILIYGLNFSPELTGIGKYTGEMARWLVEQGHEVRVVTAPPYYPEWAVHKGYNASSYGLESWHGAKVIRCPLWVPTQASGLKRLMHLASFALASLPIVLAQIRWRPNAVWTVEPALFTAPASLLVAKMARARSWLHIQDYEVNAAFSMGLLRGDYLRKSVFGMERWLMRRFDRVSTISSHMLALGAQKGVSTEKLVYFPNWVDISGIGPLEMPSEYRRELEIPDKAIVVLYSGNMGAKQGLEILASAATELAADVGIYFVFCGDGVGKKALQKLCVGLQNVKFLRLQPAERLRQFFGLADIHVLPQRADAADAVLPSKLTGMLASGRPVVVTAEAETELARLVMASGGGDVVPPGDGAGLACAIRLLAYDPARRAAMGSAARTFAEQTLDREVILKRFEAELSRMVNA